MSDFPNGLADVNEYLNTRHHSSTNIVGQVGENAKVVVQSEFDFTLKEIICNLLAGRGFKLPNIQVCVSVNLKAILGVAGLQSELNDALNQLDAAFDKFMDHTGIEQVLGRVNNALAEVTQIANMINFCAAPIQPIAIPNVLEQTMDSFLGAGKDLVDRIGQMVPDQVGGCLNFDGQDFNTTLFTGGIMGTISSNWDAIRTGAFAQNELNALIAEINSVSADINNLIDRENSVTGSESLGGSAFQDSDIDSTDSDNSTYTNTDMGVFWNADGAGIQGATRVASGLQASYNRFAGYPVIGADGTVYNNIFELFLEPGLIRLLEKESDPAPTIDEQQPVYNYCGEVVGYTRAVTQEEQTTSDGALPTAPDSPGYNFGAGTSPYGTTAGSGSTSSTININNIETDGNTIYFASSETVMLNLGVEVGDIVVRTDLPIAYARQSTATGTINDYVPMSLLVGNYLKNLDALTTNGIVIKDGTAAHTRTLVGAPNEIDITNANGVLGDITVGLADNTVIPGTGAITVPNGTTSQRPTAETGKMRYNTTTNRLEAYIAGTVNAWQTLATGSTNTVVGALNVGTENGLYTQNNNGVLEFKSIGAEKGVQIAVNSDSLMLSSSLDITNLGTGTEVFKQKDANNNFELRTITGGTGISVSLDNDNIEIKNNTIELGSANSSGPGQTEILFDGSRIAPANNTSWFFVITVLGRRTNGTGTMSIRQEGIVENNNGTLSIVSNATNETVYSNNAGSNWKLDVDTSGNVFRILVTGESGADISWGSKVELIEVS